MSDVPPNPPPSSGVRRVFENLYEELLQFAECLRLENRNLMPAIGKTDLTNHAFEKLVHEETRRRLQGRSELADKDSAAFKSCFARACREILIDNLRRRFAKKREGGRRSKSLSEDSSLTSGPELTLLALDEALGLLGQKDTHLERIAEMALYGGMSPEEISRELGLEAKEIDSKLRFALAWLRRHFEEESQP
jgi:DNA-directed RNA polymerase specialized sigma24 family protein